MAVPVSPCVTTRISCSKRSGFRRPAVRLSCWLTGALATSSCSSWSVTWAGTFGCPAEKLGLGLSGQPRPDQSRSTDAGQRPRLVHTVWITQQWFGPVYLALACVQTPKGYQQWAIVSDQPTTLATLDEYGLRFDLEENFLDDKSAGFQIESSQIEDEYALSRLGLILAMTNPVSGQRRWMDPH